MDPSNLAICFGPTLVRVPADRDPVQFQSYVNELIKNVIIHYEAVFPLSSELTYEKCIVEHDRSASVFVARKIDKNLFTNFSV